MNHYQHIKSLIYTKVTAIGDCGMKKDLTVEGILEYIEFIGWTVTLDNGVSCLVKPLSIAAKEN